MHPTMGVKMKMRGHKLRSSVYWQGKLKQWGIKQGLPVSQSSEMGCCVALKNWPPYWWIREVLMSSHCNMKFWFLCITTIHFPRFLFKCILQLSSYSEQVSQVFNFVCLFVCLFAASHEVVVVPIPRLGPNQNLDLALEHRHQVWNIITTGPTVPTTVIAMLITTVITTVTIIILTEDLLQEDKTGHTTHTQGK